MTFKIWIITIFVLFFSPRAYCSNRADHLLKIEYETINNLELNESHLPLKFEYKKDHYEAESEDKINLGIISNDGRAKKVCVQYSKPFEGDIKLLVCSANCKSWKSLGEQEVLKDKPCTIINPIRANSNQEHVTLKHKLLAPKDAQPGEYFCVIKYTLMDR